MWRRGRPRSILEFLSSESLSSSSRLTLRRRDTEGLHLSIEVGSFELQGFRGLRHVTAAFTKLLENVPALVCFPGLGQRRVVLDPILSVAAVPAQGGGEIGHLDAIGGHHDDESFDDVFELSDIPRPRIRNQHLLRFARDFLGSLSILRRELGKEMTREQWNIAFAFSKRRHVKRNDVQPEIRDPL